MLIQNWIAIRLFEQNVNYKQLSDNLLKYYNGLGVNVFL